MGGGTRLAFGILFVTLGLGGYWFAFHPYGVNNPDGSKVSNPTEVLQWIINEFQNPSASPKSAGQPADQTSNTGGSLWAIALLN